MASHHPIRKAVSSKPAVIPDKLYFRIGDVARICDVPAYVLRFWETEFPQLKPNKGGTGQRLYRKRDVEMALRIKSLLYDQGYTIPGARQIFRSDLKGADASLPVESPAHTPAPAPEVADPRAEPAADMGAVIRQEVQHRDQMASLREELRALKELLAARAAPAPQDEPEPAPSPIVSKLTTMRPRLIVELKPAVRPESRTESRPASRLVDQGDLFPSE
jgi:DNA-binding transcriptional MerR regulator